MDRYNVTRVQTKQDGVPLIGVHVTFHLAQRGQQCIGYQPPRWIYKNRNDREYLLDFSQEKLDHQHPYALE